MFGSGSRSTRSRLLCVQGQAGAVHLEVREQHQPGFRRFDGDLLVRIDSVDHR
jgi:hypothetical protein